MTSKRAPVCDKFTMKHLCGGALPCSIVALIWTRSRGARRRSAARLPKATFFLTPKLVLANLRGRLSPLSLRGGRSTRAFLGGDNGRATSHRTPLWLAAGYQRVVEFNAGRDVSFPEQKFFNPKIGIGSDRNSEVEMAAKPRRCRRRQARRPRVALSNQSKAARFSSIEICCIELALRYRFAKIKSLPVTAADFCE